MASRGSSQNPVPQAHQNDVIPQYAVKHYECEDIILKGEMPFKMRHIL